MGNENLRNVVINFDGNREAFKKLRKSFSSGNQIDMAEALGWASQNLVSRFESGEFSLDPRTYSLFSLMTDSHPNYSLHQRQKFFGSLLIEPPSLGADRQKIRKKAGLTGKEMADILSLSSKTIISRYENNKQHPSLQCWTLFLLITGQHPYYKLQPKAYKLYKKKVNEYVISV